MKKICVPMTLLLLFLTACNLPRETLPTVDIVASQVAKALTETAVMAPALPTASTPMPPITEPSPPKPTEISPTSEITATSTVTATVTSTATLAPSATSDQSDPAIRFGAPAWTEDFTSTSTQWDYSDDWSTFKVADGYFNITSKKDAYWNSWYLTAPNIQDFYLEMTFDMPTCNGDDRIGLAFRGSDSYQFYFMGITCSGKWGFEKYTKDNTIENILPYATSTDLKPVSQSNRAGVLADGSTFEFYINGKKVGQASDNSFPDTGAIGFVSRFIETIGFTTRVDKLQYWQLP